MSLTGFVNSSCGVLSQVVLLLERLFEKIQIRFIIWVSVLCSGMLLFLTHFVVSQCFDAVGWVAGRACGL